MSTGAGPALRWPIRIACGGLGMLLSWLAWGLSATWPVSAHAFPIRLLATVLLGTPFLALAAFGAGQAVLVPEAGEEALEAEWMHAHPWQARGKWLITVAAGVYGGSPIVVPFTQTAVAGPIGDTVPSHTGTDFDAFLITPA